jgi:hypothetical protein
MPTQAVRLKKYRGGRSPVSKISDKEDSAASLGHSEELCIKNSVCDMIPAVPKRKQEVRKVVPPVAG